MIPLGYVSLPEYVDIISDRTGDRFESIGDLFTATHTLVSNGDVIKLFVEREGRIYRIPSEDVGALDRACGLLFNGFKMPSRTELGDTDPAQWEKGLDCRPADPWLHQMCLVLQECDSGELYTFVSTSNTGRRA